MGIILGKGLGIGLGSAKGGGIVSAPPVPIQLGATHLYEADQGDIVTDVGPPLTVVTWPNQGSAGGAFQHLTKARQPILTTLNGHPSVLFQDTNQHRLETTSAKSTWKPLHDGTGVTLAFVYHPITLQSNRGFMIATAKTTTVDVGFGIKEYTAGGLAVEVWNGSGSNWTILRSSAVGAISAGVSSDLVFRFSSTISPHYRLLVDGVSKFNGQQSNPPSSADSTEMASMGAQTAFNYWCDGHIPVMTMIPSYLSDEDTVTLRTYLQDWK